MSKLGLGIAGEIIEGVAVQRVTHGLLDLPIVGDIARSFVSQVSGVVRSLGGHELVTEIVNQLPQRTRSFVETTLRHSGTQEFGVSEMADKNKNKQKGQGQGGGGSVDLEVKALMNIASLFDPQRKDLMVIIDKIPAGDLRQLVLQKLGSFNVQQLKGLGDLVRLKGEKADLVVFFGLEKTPEAKEAKLDPKGDGVKVAALFAKLAVLGDETFTRISEVLADPGHDSADDTVNFNRRMADFYGDGTDPVLTSAVESLKKIAQLPLDQRRNFFGVRPNWFHKVTDGVKRLVGGGPRTPETQAQIHANHVEARVGTNFYLGLRGLPLKPPIDPITPAAAPAAPETPTQPQNEVK